MIRDIIGQLIVVTSGKDWKSFNQGPLRYSNIYHGEEYDANREISDWSTTEYDDSAWNTVVTQAIDPKIALVPKRHHAVRTTEELEPVNITEPAPGLYVFDLGQNMVGWPRLSLPRSSVPEYWSSQTDTDSIRPF